MQKDGKRWGLMAAVLKNTGELTENCENGVDDVQKRFINIKLI